MLFIMLIGMISLTAFGATAEPGQKSKAAFEKHDLPVMSIDAVSVAAADAQIVASQRATTLICIQANSFENRTSIVESFKLPDDVGWQSSGNDVAINHFTSTKARAALKPRHSRWLPKKRHRLI